MKNFRVAIYYSNKFGRNDGAPLYYLHNLRKVPGVEVMHLLPEGDTAKFGKFDLHLWVDWGEDGLPHTTWLPPEDKGIRAYVASDTHLGPDYRFSFAQNFDHVYFNQLRAVEEYKPAKRNKLVEWLPHAVEPDAYPRFEIVKKYDVCFIGHMQDVKNYNGFSRTDALDRLFKEFPNFYYGSRNPIAPGYCLFEDAAKKFCQSKVVFNVSIGDDINMRVFETLGTGSFLITNYVPTLEKLFPEKKYFDVYHSLDELIVLTKHYLKNDATREKMAMAGQKIVLSQHTYLNRVMKVLSDAGYKQASETSSI